MPKRIYVGKDVAEAARATGISVDTLKKAEAGQLELSRREMETLQRWLKGKAPGPIDIA